ncbi:AraC family transcriptional regulator [Novosphingobium sp. G106]|uniref:AraC family transcriptional regulator ligand-binding domain-containing protein n=1 Tax=Novosphingobium sp. G106 TaxID=2849500 RepID=UPI001C2D859C|nr:AraC family transcriptional regulator ligand-binding domain-containing protein [Novosphingobium sp. G106]MBV1689665.1 AraC family transcriptional regulator [Novosphingobium sp. G106]
MQTYFSVARFVGLDPYLWMRKNNIRSEDIADPQNMIAASALLKLYEDSAVASGRPDFGLLIAESRSVASLGPISLLLRYQPTVRSIIDQVAINMRLLNDIVQARIQDDGQIAMVRIEMLPGFASRQTIESTVAIACRSYCELMVGAWQPESIHFRHGAPRIWRRTSASSAARSCSTASSTVSSALPPRSTYPTPGPTRRWRRMRSVSSTC